MALNSLFCADVPLSIYSLTHPVPIRYATSFSILDKVDEGVSARTKR